MHHAARGLPPTCTEKTYREEGGCIYTVIHSKRRRRHRLHSLERSLSLPRLLRAVCVFLSSPLPPPRSKSNTATTTTTTTLASRDIPCKREKTSGKKSVWWDHCSSSHWPDPTDRSLFAREILLNFQCQCTRSNLPTKNILKSRTIRSLDFFSFFRKRYSFSHHGPKSRAVRGRNLPMLPTPSSNT